MAVSAHPEVNRLVERCGYAAAALTILPIPGSEIIGVMPLHVGMVVGIANHHGRTITRESAMELVVQIGATVGLSLVGSRLATTAAKFVLPGLGGLVAAPFMFASTLGIGAVADAYFQHGDLPRDRMREVYKDAAASARSAFRPEKMRDSDAMDLARDAAERGKSAPAPEAEPEPDPKERLKRAREMLDEGLIDQAQFDEVQARILAEL
ncbi:MAG: hypothetical protein R3F59_18615 [Myxococcota bacterium]